VKTQVRRRLHGGASRIRTISTAQGPRHLHGVGSRSCCLSVGGESSGVETFECPPGTDAPLQRAANTDADLGMAPPDFVENGHRPQAWSALQQRHYLAVPNLSERVATSAATRRFCGVGFSAQGLFEGSYYRRMPGAADPRAAWIFEAQRRLSR
jgi:hypothetical protein